MFAEIIKVKKLFLVLVPCLLLTPIGCLNKKQNIPVSSSGIFKTEVKVEKNLEGITIEQQNVRERLINDNKVGAVKHLYIISPYSGEVIIYSTVKGKVTSSAKRLTPTSVATNDTSLTMSAIPIRIGKEVYYTSEVLQDDGTYGTSEPYIFWWDSKGVYHQHFLTGGQIVHVSDQILRVNPSEIKINLETK